MELNTYKDFRNVVIHKYNTVDLDIVWDIIQNKLEPLRSQVEDILAKEKAEEHQIKKQKTLP